VFSFVHGDGLSYRCTASRFASGQLAEVFLSASKAGSAVAEVADTAAILTSLLLQYGVPAATIAGAVHGSAVAMAIELAEAPS
jgi:hypothetical protein